MILADMRARVLRLRQLAAQMGREAAIWKAQQGPLLPLERKQYLDRVHDVIAGAAAAVTVLEAAAVRLARSDLSQP
jgi:hypothetical protein